MANEKKLTMKEKYAMLLNIVKASDDENAEMLEAFINERVTLIENKKSSKNAAKEEENEKNKARVLEVLSGLENPATVTEIQAYCTGFSNQKMTSILGKLCDDGVAERTTAKGKSYYKAVEV